MRWVRFTEVQLMQGENKKLLVREVSRLIAAGRVDSVSPGGVPGETVGPDGSTIMVPASYIHMAGDHILVTTTMEETLWKLTWESIDIEGELTVTETIKAPDDTQDENSLLEGV